jgi:cell division protein FtsL
MAKFRVILQLTLIAAIAVGFSFYLISQYPKFHKFEKERERLETEISRAKKEEDRLKTELERLGSPEFVEQLARELLGMVRKDEFVFIMEN